MKISIEYSLSIWRTVEVELDEDQIDEYNETGKVDFNIYQLEGSLEGIDTDLWEVGNEPDTWDVSIIEEEVNDL